jgi:hypothetical protein
MVTILDPRAAPGVPVVSYALRADLSAPRLVVGLLSNGFPDATTILRKVAEHLAILLPQARIELFERADPTTIAPQATIAEVAARCDAVVTALGHCGSCTSSTVRDAVNVAKAGTPVAALVSEKFWGAGAFVARSVGVPDVPRVKLPYPIAGTGVASISAAAPAIAAGVLAAWAAERPLAEAAE